MKKKWFYILSINYIIAIVVFVRILLLGQILHPFENLLSILFPENFLEQKTFIIQNEKTETYPGRKASYSIILTGYIENNNIQKEIILHNTDYIQHRNGSDKLLVYESKLTGSLFLLDKKSIKENYVNSIFKIYFIISFVLTTFYLIHKFRKNDKKNIASY